jgi:hypothetical protein
MSRHKGYHGNPVRHNLAPIFDENVSRALTTALHEAASVPCPQCEAAIGVVCVVPEGAPELEAGACAARLKAAGYDPMTFLKDRP